MEIVALILGLLAVALFLLCYQFKKRIHIVLCNIASRVFYILQYIFLFAFEGAAMDIAAILSSVFAARKNKGFVAKHKKLIFICLKIIIVVVGLLLYKNIFSLFSIIGVLFETVALWLDNEKHIRILSLLGAPFWLIYNVVCGAFGSAIGNALSIISIITAMFRHDIKFKKKEINSDTSPEEN